jgi:tripartite-type tricarboxylate transporter receptor subunit TctC
MKTHRGFATFAAAAALLGTVGSAQAQAQEWPAAPIKVIVPFDAGSTPDTLARVVGEGLSARLHQPVIVENRSGAAGNIGTDAVAKAAPDGLTIGVSIGGPLTVNPVLYRKLPFNPDRDLAPISIAVSQPLVLAVSKKVPASSAKELVALLKSTQGKYSYGSVGVGSISHLAMEWVASASGATLIRVPYRGAGSLVTDLQAQTVDMALMPAAALMPSAKAGSIRAIAVAAPRRSPLVAELPTFAESGLPDIDGDGWIGFVAPAKVPPRILSRLNAEIVAVLADPAVRTRLRNLYMEPVGSSTERFREVIAADSARWRPLIQKLEIKLD